MKQARKTANLLIRDTSKRFSKDQGQNIKSRTSVVDNQKKKWQIKNQNIELQKQLTKAENLTEQQVQKIHKEAQRTVSKKMRSTQTKIQNDMVSFLEIQCNKIGGELQKKQIQNSKLKNQITQLRKNIDFLNRKLENVFKDHQSLAKNNDYGMMQKQQMKEQIFKLKSSLKRREDQADFMKTNLQKQIQKLREENEAQKNKILSIQTQYNLCKQDKEEVQQLLEQKESECQYIKQYFQEKKKQWDLVKQTFESNTKEHIQKKVQKINKNHVQIQSLTDKLKQEQNIRKKLVEKNKQLQKQSAKKSQQLNALQEQITNFKKRVNDLSILKSSNNTILNQKIVKLQEQNANLKKQIDILSGKKMKVEEQSKPYLFGPSQDDD